MTIKVYPRTNALIQPSIDLTDYIVNEHKDQKRTDDAFALTTFSVMIPSNLFDYAGVNIPPFTLFSITVDNVVSWYFGSSEVSEYLRQQDNVTYFWHDITLLEPTAMLEALQVGSKTFTNHKDKDYINQLCEIINQEYIGITLQANISWTNETEAHSYSYDKGISAYEILNDIFRLHNSKIRCTITNAPTYSTILLYITDINLSNALEVSITDTNLTMVKISQNQDDYCKYLESQVDNVVDRNTLSIYDNLTVRSDDNTITADNSMIVLPQKVESIEKFEVYLNVTERLQIAISIADLEALEAVGDYHDYYYWVTYQQIVAQCPYIANLVDTTNPNAKVESRLYACAHGVITGTTNQIGILTIQQNDSQPTATTLWYDISKMLLDVSIYTALEVREQSKYCYYESGDNKIKGIYQYYNDDWIHQLIGDYTTPMLDHISDNYDYLNYSNVVIGTDSRGNNYYSHLNYSVVNNTGDNPINVMFRVEAHPITSQYVKDTKQDAPFNQYGYNIASRSYGNSANYIDYDIMRKNISISNKSLGTPELALQFLNVCNLTTNSKFTYKGQLWYVKSLIMTILRDRILYDVNSAVDYNKQADAIGVRTQYEATKIALDNIKERILYFEKNNELVLSLSKQYYLKIYFGYQYESPRTIWLPVSIYASGSGLTLVASCVDNYSAGTYYEQIDNETTKFVNRDAPYCDENAEIYQILQMDLIHFVDGYIDIAKSRQMPYCNPSSSDYTIDLAITTNEKIYKDEHEALSFTVYLPNGDAL